jgi:hypothetical protein
MRRWAGAGCAFALMCVCASPRGALGQAPAAESKVAGGAKKTTTATPKKHAAVAAKGARSSTSSPAALPGKSPVKAHPASHPAANRYPKTSAAAAAHGGKSKYASSRKKKKTTARGQQKIEPERAQAIQEALIREHYMSGEAAGTWNEASEEAMRRYQADHGWQAKTVPDSRALISLGLGPSHDRLLNPESAMTTEPAAPHAESLSTGSHSADPGGRMNAVPVPSRPAAPPARDSPGPQ